MKNFDGIIRKKIQALQPVVKKTIAWASVIGLLVSGLAFVAPLANVQADNNSVNFENPPYIVGDINGQDGWLKTGSYDAAVTSNTYGFASFGAQTLRISDAVTSGSFGDQTFSKPLVNEAGETDALNGGFSGGVRQPHFEAQFDLASALPTLQAGMHLSVSPDRGDGARMSYLRFEDQADGIHVFFDDVQGTSNPANFVETDIATIDRNPHTIKFVMDFVDGPSNDVVQIYIDGALVHTGTSWENYYRFDPESNPSLVSNSRTVDSLLFRESGTANLADAGNGFLIDNLSLSSGPTPGQTCTSQTLSSSTNTQFHHLTTSDPAGSNAPGSFTLGTPGSAVVVDSTGYPGAWNGPSADPNLSGSNWVSNEVIQPTTPPGPDPGQDGSVDTWRLFSDSLTIPADATLISSPTLFFTADNSVQAFLDNVSVGTATSYTTVESTAPLSLSTGSHEFDFVVKNDGVASDNNPTGLIYKVTVNYCEPNTPPPTSAKVTIVKYLDGTAATAVSANNTAFPMHAVFPGGEGDYTLSPNGFNNPNPYQATTSDMPIGSNYSTFEKLDGAQVASTCDGAHPYALVGYTNGDTLNAAAAGTPNSDPSNAAFTNLQSDKFVIVWNKSCTVTPPTNLKVHILKYLDGAEATSVSANNFLFPMTATWTTANLNGGAQASGTYTLGNNFGGATELYGADTAAMQAPADYTTSEVTDANSQVVALPEQCVPGKYLLSGYQTSSVDFATAASQPMTGTAPVFTGLTADQYVIVDNSSCPTTGSLTVEKDTIGGNGTFNFTSDIPGHATFSIGTVNGVGYSDTFANLTPGTYHVTETNLPKGWSQTDSDCSAVAVTAGGAVSCTITNTSNKLLGEIKGTKYEDRDGDGKLTDGDHHRLGGWTIYIDKNNNGSLDSGEISTVTDSHGNYHFSGLPAGTYVIREVGQAGWIQTVPSNGSYTINLAAGKISKKNNFGNFKLGSISGIKYYDQNGNKHKDASEVVLPNWTINLYRLGNPVAIATTTTDANGKYTFSNIGPGTYQVREVQQPTWVQSTNNPSNIWMHSGLNVTHIDFGNKHPGDGPPGHDKDNDDEHGSH